MSFLAWELRCIPQNLFRSQRAVKYRWLAISRIEFTVCSYVPFEPPKSRLLRKSETHSSHLVEPDPHGIVGLKLP